VDVVHSLRCGGEYALRSNMEGSGGDSEAAGKTTAEIAAELAARDHRDSTRKASPLRPADDAVIVDTSDLTIDEVVQRVVDLAAERSAG